MIVIFEDEYFTTLLPLVYMRAVYELRCGATTLLEKIIRTYPKEKIGLHMRSYLAPTRKKLHPYPINNFPDEDTLFINGRLLCSPKVRMARAGREEMLLWGEDEIAAFRVHKENITKLRPLLNAMLSFKTLEKLGLAKTSSANLTLLKYPWELVHFNHAEIVADFTAARGRTSAKVYPGAILLNRAAIALGNGARILSGAVLNAEEGPIIIGENAEVMEQAVIRGPAVIGHNSKIKVGAKIYAGTTIGPVCKVGGEVEGSIIQGYSNKQHDGFLGHSYLSEWVNLGAGTDNSDLKNNYGTVKVCINEEMVDSGETFVGLIMGDHSKCSIGTTFNTGSVVGVSCNLFGPGFHPKAIPSFSWGSPQGYVEYDPPRALNVAKKVLSRRKLEMGKEEQELFLCVYQLTSLERDKENIKKGTLEA